VIINESRLFPLQEEPLFQGHNVSGVKSEFQFHATVHTPVLLASITGDRVLFTVTDHFQLIDTGSQ